MTEQVALVTVEGNDLGACDKWEAHQGRGRLHRAFSVVLFDEIGHVCLQRRSGRKKLWPGVWSNACCSHPRLGESGELAVRRRVREELGAEATDLHELFEFRYLAKYDDIGTELELCHVWVGKIESSRLDPDMDEVGAVAFLPPQLVTNSLHATPSLFTPWFSIEWPVISGHLSNLPFRFTDAGCGRLDGVAPQNSPFEKFACDSSGAA